MNELTRPMLIVMSGLPGSGKSTLAQAVARELAACVASVDVIEAAMVRSGVEKSLRSGIAAYEVAADVAAQQLRLGRTVIADAVNAVEQARTMWRTVAEAVTVPIQFVWVEHR
jgi:predicted kinase